MSTPTPRTILITGATDGLGRALAPRLAADGAALILHGRDQRRLEDITAEVTALAAARSGHRPVAVLADLAELKQVRELRFAVNYLAGFALTLELLPGPGCGRRACA